MEEKRKRKSAEEGRQALIDATLRCLAKHGYHGTSTRKIADEAGVTASLVKHYFSGKAELIRESYNYFKVTEFEVYREAANAAGPDPWSKLRAFFQAYFIYNAEQNNLRMPIWVSLLEPVLADSEIAGMQARNFELIVAEIEALVFAIFEERERVCSPEEARDVAIAINSLVDGLWLECSLNPDRMRPEEAVRISSFVLEAILQKKAEA